MRRQAPKLTPAGAEARAGKVPKPGLRAGRQCGAP